MYESIVKPVLDFVKWFLLWASGKDEEPEIQKDLLYAQKRGQLSKPIVGLIEIFEENPQRTFPTQEVFDKWREKLIDWYGEEKGKEGTSRDGTFYALNDLANDDEPLVERISEESGDLWKIAEEYEEYRPKREPAPTIFRNS